MSSFERLAVQRLVDKAAAVGVDIPAELGGLLGRLECSSYPARMWAQQHPDEDRPPCCWGAVNGAEYCTCWRAVYDVEQAPPRPLTGPQDITPRPSMCADCAFKPGSPERSEHFTEEALLELPHSGDPFWCHDGMRRPTHWEHPDGRVVPGSPDDWQPVGINGIPYRADGRPALLCAGWAALAAKASR